MAKAKKSVFFCQNCGHEESKWLGQCPMCKEWNSFVEECVTTSNTAAVKAAKEIRIVPLSEVKTFKEITKLEKNGMFVYESVPGTAVEHFEVSEDVISFKVSGTGDAQITLELEPDTDYIVYMNDMNVGDMKTNLSAKLSVSAELGKESVEIKVVRK